MSTASEIYRTTRKKNDQLFNTYVMRPLAAVAVALLARTPVTPNQVTLANLVVFVGAAAAFVALPGYAGALIAVGALEFSYMLDCADGMLARHKRIASKQGHLLDFFVDESKAILLVGALGVRFWRFGALGPRLAPVAPGEPWFLIASVAAVTVVASGISLTNFVRRPELSGRETTVEAHYEANAEPAPVGGLRKVAALVFTFLRFLNHYPSHIWVFALFGRLDVFFWLYFALNSLYLARGWVGLLLRFGRFAPAE